MMKSVGPKDHLGLGQPRPEDSLDLAHTREGVLRGLFQEQEVPPQDPQRFERIRTLGWGSMGRVDLARDRTLGREVALKTINPSAAEHPTARARIYRESQALARIDHPNVVRVFDVFDVSGCLTLCDGVRRWPHTTRLDGGRRGHSRPTRRGPSMCVRPARSA